VQQYSCKISFNTSDSWVILSPIEISIKNKIEAIGTPLKDWNIIISRGVLTGCNDAFIISSSVRNEILSHCKDKAERQRTEAIIRPILRGRDIKRYDYDWAGLYIIATFPSLHYNIDEYSSIKSYLLSYGIERLEQSGSECIKGGKKIKSRKKTNNSWFETQDSINYWDDFNKPKIVWGEISDRSKFALDEKGEYIPEATSFLLVGDDIYSLFFFLNSSIAEWYFSKLGPRTGMGTIRWKKYTVELIPAPHLSISFKKDLYSSFKKYLSKDITEHQLCNIVNEQFYAYYKLSDQEIGYVTKYFDLDIKIK
jgi:hypothetical protein